MRRELLTHKNTEKTKPTTAREAIASWKDLQIYAGFTLLRQYLYGQLAKMLANFNTFACFISPSTSPSPSSPVLRLRDRLGALLGLCWRHQSDLSPIWLAVCAVTVAKFGQFHLFSSKFMPSWVCDQLGLHPTKGRGGKPWVWGGRGRLLLANLICIHCPFTFYDNLHINKCHFTRENSKIYIAFIACISFRFPSDTFGIVNSIWV